MARLGMEPHEWLRALRAMTEDGSLDGFINAVDKTLTTATMHKLTPEQPGRSIHTLDVPDGEDQDADTYGTYSSTPPPPPGSDSGTV